MRSVQELFKLDGRVAVVTGAGSGLGVVFSEAFAEAGASVVCAGLHLDAVERTATSIGEMGGSALAIEVDVTDETAVERMVRTTVDHFGRLDILVNNAGIAVVGPPEDLSTSDWQRVIDVDLTGVFLGARSAARQMIAAGHGGHIINIASILGAVASEPAPAPAYSAAKGGVINLTRDLAVQWAPKGILVNAIGPGYFPTDMTAEAFSNREFIQEIERRTPLGRVGKLEELKGIIVFLASDASSYVTGQTIFVDGGWTAW
jgi:NAD(P)-dependent dehydrogenase (short-subunit alcohol dehydrogenase family)